MNTRAVVQPNLARSCLTSPWAQRGGRGDALRSWALTAPAASPDPSAPLPLPLCLPHRAPLGPGSLSPGPLHGPFPVSPPEDLACLRVLAAPRALCPACLTLTVCHSSSVHPWTQGSPRVYHLAEWWAEAPPPGLPWTGGQGHGLGPWSRVCVCRGVPPHESWGLKYVGACGWARAEGRRHPHSGSGVTGGLHAACMPLFGGGRCAWWAWLVSCPLIPADEGLR